MKRKILFITWSICFALLSNFAIAASSPVVMLDTTSKQVIHALEKNKVRLQNNPNVVYKIVNQYLLPHVDVYGMSRSVLGRNAWNNATKSQRQRFTKEFTKLVVRTYSGALEDYTNETVKFHPIRGGYQGKRFVRVNSTIIRSSAKNVTLNYSLVLKGSQWKVYDMSVEGISLLQSFRSQFAAELSKGDLNLLISNLAKHNK